MPICTPIEVGETAGAWKIEDGEPQHAGTRKRLEDRMRLATLAIEIDSDLKEDTETVLAELGLTFEQAVLALLDKCVETGGIPLDFDPEWVIDDSFLFDREIVKELAGRGLRGNSLLLARKERRELLERGGL